MTDLGCEICGAAKEPGKRICGNCFKGIGRTRATCQTCGQANRWLDHELRCRRCRDNSTRRCADCQSTSSGLFTWNEVRLCAPCALRRELDRTIPAEPGGALVRLRPVILAAEPVTTRRWLRRAHDLLTGLDQEHISLDHTTLDGLPHPKSVEHLRALLIATDILPADPAGPIRRLQPGTPPCRPRADRSPSRQQVGPLASPAPTAAASRASPSARHVGRQRPPSCRTDRRLPDRPARPRAVPRRDNPGRHRPVVRTSRCRALERTALPGLVPAAPPPAGPAGTASPTTRQPHGAG